MLRIALAALLLTATLSVVPTGTASHIGPCWHEYIEAGLQAPFDVLNHGFREALSNAGGTIGGCIDGTIYFVTNICRFTTICAWIDIHIACTEWTCPLPLYP